MPEINHCTLTARLVSIEPVRRTPAGIFCCRLWLEHRSRQLENGRPVATIARIAVQLVGDRWAKIVEQLQPDMRIEVEGFLTAAGFRGEAQDKVQLQATRLEIVP